jgi:Ni2+-binding GTPase involved in maturation of urease and hydrogenase
MTQLILLGGFLGAGKTTTLLRLAGNLAAAGNRVGILTNDQGEELVDTELFRASGFDAKDVRGGCFCCRLNDFVEKAEALRQSSAPDFLLAEPVGSCTDLVATVLRPLREMHSHAFAISPYTVLLDPLRAHDVLSTQGRASLSEKVTYIYKLQQMEADAIAVNKIDLLRDDERWDLIALLRSRFPGKRVLTFSARSGEGFETLQTALTTGVFSGARPSPAIDYDVYAAGEAELAWLDATYGIDTSRAVDMDAALTGLGRLLASRLASAALPIAHVKVLLRAGDIVCALSIARSGAEPELTRASGASARSMEMVVNARVAGEPQELEALIEHCCKTWAAALDAPVTQRSRSSFSPARPVPVQRIDAT